MVNTDSPVATPYQNYGATDDLLLAGQGPASSTASPSSIITGGMLPSAEGCFPATGPDSLPDEEKLSELAAIRDHLRRSLSSVKKMTCGQIFAMMFCVLGLVVAGAAQLLTMNLWIGAFPSGYNINRPFTILTMSSTLNALICTIGFVGWCLVKRPKLQFMFTKRSLWLSFWMGFSVALNGVLIVSATPHVPEILQAFLFSTGIIWTFVFVKVMFSEKRSYVSPLVIISFFLSLGGIVAGSASQFSSVGLTASTAVWALIFAFSLIPGALNGVVSAKFMRYFTVNSRGVNGEGRRISTRNLQANDALLREHQERAQQISNDSIAAVGTDSATAKVAMMAFGNISQCILMFCLLPLSVLPWFGTTPDMAALGDGLKMGYKCSLNMLPGCEQGPLYFAMFNLCFFMSSVFSMFLNYYSPAMTSMVNQLVSPTAALVLIFVPAWSVGPDNNNLAYSLIAVVLITVGTMLYTIWEESTRNIGVEVPTRDASVSSGEVASDLQSPYREDVV